MASDDPASAARLLFDGDVTAASDVSREPSEETFDLRDIEPSVVVDAAGTTLSERR